MYVKDVANVAIGHAPRLGQFGFMQQNDAVEGVILMRVGEQAQVVLKKVEALTETLNQTLLPPDVKIVPFYDRTELIEETTKTVEAQPGARHDARPGRARHLPLQRPHRR